MPSIVPSVSSGPIRERGSTAASAAAELRHARPAFSPLLLDRTSRCASGPAGFPLVDVWGDGRFGFNNEAAVLSYSTDGGGSWSELRQMSLPGDRTLFAAVAITPDGSRMYVVYMGFTAPFQVTTANPRPVRGVFLSSAVGADGAPLAWSAIHRRPPVMPGKRRDRLRPRISRRLRLRVRRPVTPGHPIP